MWPFSHPKCPVCRNELVPNSGTVGHAAYLCPTCIKNNTPTPKEGQR